VLPALENVLYGANLSNILSAHTHWILDLIAWLPYGLGHFTLPLICSGLIFFFASPGSTQAFAKAFGFMSILGVAIQLALPCTPPWYERLHGLDPAHYGMEGSPAGLARIDELLGFDMYTTSFTTAPVPFGAFPSLHSADATLEALFMQYFFPQFRPFFIMYVGWVWWATMYLNHHYAVDLVGGSLIAAITYYIVRSRWLPRVQPDKRSRWEYEYVEYGERPKTRDEEYGYGFGNGFGLGLLERPGLGDSDEWTVGSSSSFDSIRRGESGSSSSSPGSLSPATPNDDFRQALFGISPQGDAAWDADRIGRETELAEVVVIR
jgi:membrane-associated phospholipid phosphatase